MDRQGNEDNLVFGDDLKTHSERHSGMGGIGEDPASQQQLTGI